MPITLHSCGRSSTIDGSQNPPVLRLSTKAATIDSATTPATDPAASTIERIVLGSRSPRRRELLQLVVPTDRIVVRPPRQSDEAGFADLSGWQAIRERLGRIVRTKLNDVLAQHSAAERQQTLFLVADTVIVAERPADAPGGPAERGSPAFEVLGQPPEGPDWATTVDAWFRERLAGRTHWAITGLEWLAPGERSLSSQTVTAVQFRSGLDAFLPHYLGTGESRGKAGGYAIQGLGSIFVERLDGSLTNVVGLPLERVLADLVSLGANHLLPSSR